MKKIIISNNTLNGINLFRDGLIKELEKNNNIIVLADSEKIENKNNYKFRNIRIERRGINPIKDIMLFFNYIKILKKEKPNLVTHYTIKPNIYGSLACSALNIPYINTVNGCGTAFLKEDFVGMLVRKLYKIAFKNSKNVFFQNKDDMNEFLSRNIVTNNQCVYVPGSGVDLKKFSNSYKKKNAKIVFLFIGRLIKEKGVEVFLETAKEIKKKYNNVEFQLLGPINKSEKDNISYEKLKKYEEEKIITYLGISKDVRNEIKEVDCILFPSYYREGVPRSLLEAGAMGKAIITTDSVGCKDTVIEGKNGYLSAPNNLESTILKVEKYLNLSEEQRELMGMESRKKIENEFDEVKVFEIYKNYIKKILEDK